MTEYILSIIVITLFSIGEASLSCYEYRCNQCPESALNNYGREVQCKLTNYTSENWLGGFAGPPSIPSEKDADFACLKLTANNPNIIGDSTDIIRGCALRVRVEELCHRLTAIEHARGKIYANCYYCYGDNCNNAKNININITMFLMIISIINFIKYFLLKI